MTPITRRAALGAITTIPLARPSLIRAQSNSTPIKIGLLSDLGGPNRDYGGFGSKVAAELACEDIGGALLDRPLQVLQADDQNKADIATGLAREWLDYRGVGLLADGAGSSAGLAIQEVARQRKHIYVMCTPSATALIGKQCSPYGFQFRRQHLCSGQRGRARRVVKTGRDSWFFVTADYEFGTSLERDTTGFVKQNGGNVLGSVRAPLGTTDFSQYILQAQTSGAKVIGLATGGGHAELHQAGGRVRRCPTRPDDRHPAAECSGRALTGSGDLPGPGDDHLVLDWAQSPAEAAHGPSDTRAAWASRPPNTMRQPMPACHTG